MPERAPSKSQLRPAPAPPAAEWHGVLGALDDAVFVKDDRFRFIYANPACCRILGRPLERLVGLVDADFVTSDDAAQYREHDAAVLADGRAQTSLSVFTDADGMRRVMQTKKTRWVDAAGRAHVIGIVRDLTALNADLDALRRANADLAGLLEERNAELRINQAQLESMAYYDPTTGLPNRRLLLRRLERQLDAGVAVLLIDLDQFKQINDTRGHAYGDELLRALADRLREIEGYSMLARWSGDEFVAVTPPGCTPDDDQLDALAARLVAEVRRPLLLRGELLDVTVSVGAAAAPRHGADMHTLIKHADAAMYRAKEAGRNRHAVFDEGLGIAIHQAARFETRLRAAINLGAIRVALQPLVSARSRQVVAMEALARWHDAELGDVPPSRFVPVAERMGLVHDLGLAVARRAMTLEAPWLPEQVRLSVNLSAQQLHVTNLVRDVRALLDQTGFPPQRLEFEITETTAAQLGPRTLAVLGALRDFGIGIALDDFGTGYSSLALLQRLPIDRIKIDRSFVSDLPGNARSAALVEAMVRMAQALQLEVVAEGIEREDQYAFMRALGCNELQGWLFGRPQLVP
jgi:diguanylate cyclase (GGDEF)-like protein/PAS domain S-box-containing protein